MKTSLSALRSPRSARVARGGFTLIEMLAVMGIIVLLMGLLFPAFMGVRDRARDAETRDLVIQTADAWNMLCTEKGRFPGKALLSAWSTSGYEFGEEGGDLQFEMSPGICCVLNWWVPKGPIPAADKANFKPTYTGGFAKGNLINAGCNGDSVAKMDFWPHDDRLERSSTQRVFGMVVPWAERALHVGPDGEDLADGEIPTFDSAVLKSVKHGLVTVIIDSNGDGKVTVPTGEELHASAAAWSHDEKNQRLITSW